MIQNEQVEFLDDVTRLFFGDLVSLAARLRDLLVDDDPNGRIAERLFIDMLCLVDCCGVIC